MRSILVLLYSLFLGFALVACGQDESSSGGAPGLGEQVDRVGRAMVPVLLLGAFDGDSAAVDALKDTFNTTAIEEIADFSANIKAALGYHDGLDGSCGDQLLADGEVSDSQYDDLAAVLADDRLYLDLEQSNCQHWLGVERISKGVLDADDCGGRTLSKDVADSWLSLLISGDTSSYNDGIASDELVTSDITFPFVRTL